MIRYMWLAHLLTISRIPLGILFWTVLDRPAVALAVIVTAALTDMVDGRIARGIGRRRQLAGQKLAPGPGSWLDPLCDKFFVLSVLVALYFALRPPALIVVAIAAREIVLVPLALAYRLGLLRTKMRYDFRAGWPGKVATIVQFVAVAALLFRHPSSSALAVVAAGVGLTAAAYYIARGLRLGRVAATET